MPRRRIQLRFEDLNAFQSEFQENIAHGGVFVATDETFELMELVEVDLDLRFCDQRSVLEAEVVSVLSRAAGGAGGRAGVALHFLESAAMVRLLLSEMAGIDSPPDPPETWPGRSEQTTRRHTRTRTRLAATVEADNERRAASTINVSASGALLAVEGGTIPVGAPVVISLTHPRTGAEHRLPGSVVRHAETDDRAVALGVEFDNEADHESETTRFLEDLLAAAHARLLGGISGTLATLGAPNLVQMLATCSEQGTLVVTGEHDSAYVLFERGGLRYAKVGRATSVKALTRLLSWTEGAFEFRPAIDDGEPEGVPIPLDAALLEGLQHVDELNRLDRTKLPLRGIVDRRAPDPGGLDRIEETVLGLAGEGRTLSQVLDELPDYDSDILEAVSNLADRGLIEIVSGD